MLHEREQNTVPGVLVSVDECGCKQEVEILRNLRDHWTRACRWQRKYMNTNKQKKSHQGGKVSTPSDNKCKWNLVVFKKYHFFLYTLRGLLVHSPWQMSELSSLDAPEIDTNKIDTNQRSYISKGSLTHVKIYAKTLHKCKLSHSDQKRTD